ncbi:MAG: glutathione peroxidase [Gammaproteobacteria bacterium]|nr:glutathione peroxidase [Gammaproteobacteria bacterium]
MTSPIYTYPVKLINGTESTLQEFSGKVLLIVNTASQCGFTPQYEGLEALYKKYKDQGLVVLGFPCNQFGAQEPGNASEIASFCSTNYHISFPLFAKIEVNGNNAHILYKFLKSKQKGLLGSEAIKWNFSKFLINRKGEVVDRFAPMTTPAALESVIVQLLQGSPP